VYIVLKIFYGLPIRIRWKVSIHRMVFS